MIQPPSISWKHHPLLRDYGMLFVLILLVALFSMLTLKSQHPTGDDAGREVAKIIRSQTQDRGGVVLAVGRDTLEDREFTATVAKLLQGERTQVVTVNGSPADARQELERLFETTDTIDAVAANAVTAKWTVYSRFPQLASDHIVTPRAYLWPDFLKVSNLLGVSNQTAIYAIIAIGMTMVIITGGIDLSVGSLVALAAVTTGLVIRDFAGGTEASLLMTLVGITTGLGVCTLAGTANGLLVTRFKIPPFITSLGMMMMASGLAFRWSEGRSISQLPESFALLARGNLLGIPTPIWLMLTLYAVGHLVMSRTVLGRYVYAIGGNAQAAHLSGVPVQRVLVLVYALSGTLAGLGGVMLASQLSAGDPKFGQMYELEVIAAVVVGGTSLMGGQGKILGTLIGAFIIAVIKNGMNLTDVDPFNQKIVLGAVLTVAVLLDRIKRQA